MWTEADGRSERTEEGKKKGSQRHSSTGMKRSYKEKVENMMKGII